MSSEKKGFFTRLGSARLRLIDKAAEGLSRPPIKIPGFLNALPLKRTATGPHTDNPDVKTWRDPFQFAMETYPDGTKVLDACTALPKTSYTTRFSLIGPLTATIYRAPALQTY